jgi:hypothetical protein
MLKLTLVILLAVTGLTSAQHNHRRNSFNSNEYKKQRIEKILDGNVVYIINSGSLSKQQYSSFQSSIERKMKQFGLIWSHPDSTQQKILNRALSRFIINEMPFVENAFSKKDEITFDHIVYLYGIKQEDYSHALNTAMDIAGVIATVHGLGMNRQTNSDYILKFAILSRSQNCALVTDSIVSPALDFYQACEYLSQKFFHKLFILSGDKNSTQCN